VPKKGEVSAGVLCWIWQRKSQQRDSESGGSAKARDSENDPVRFSGRSWASQRTAAAPNFDFLSCVQCAEEQVNNIFLLPYVAFEPINAVEDGCQ